MEPTQNFDPAIYGGTRSDAPIPVGIVRPVAAPVDVEAEAIKANKLRGPFLDAAMQGSELVARAGAVNEQVANRVEATLGESAKAAASSWYTASVYEYMTGPKFKREFGYDAGADMQAVPFEPSEAEDKLLRSAVSREDFVYRLNRVQEKQRNNIAMGDNPVMSFAVSMADPLLIAADVASAGSARLAFSAGMAARTARLTAAGVAFGANYGIGKVAQKVDAVSDTDVVVNALFAGALAPMGVGKLGRAEKLDPTFPDAELRDHAQRVSDSLPEPVAVAVRAEAAEPHFVAKADTPEPGAPSAEQVPTYKVRSDAMKFDHVPARSGDAVLDDIIDQGGEWADLAKQFKLASYEVLQRTKVRVASADDFAKAGRKEQAFYNPGAHEVVLTAAATADTRVAMHELAHALTVHKLNYGRENPLTAHGKIVSELEALRQESLAAVNKFAGAGRNIEDTTKYLNKNVEEFVAGLFWGKSQFTSVLSVLPDKGRKIVSSMVRSVRKLLGLTPATENGLTRAIGLTQELIELPLKVTLANSDTTIRYAPELGAPPVQSVVKQHDSITKNVGSSIAWNLHKTLAGFGTEGKRIADLLVDDPVNMTADSATSQQRAIRSDLSAKQYVYEDLLREEMAARGFGHKETVVKPEAAQAAQHDIEQAVATELLYRDLVNAGRIGVDPQSPASIKAMADAAGEAHRAGLVEQKAAGVAGADVVEHNSGYFERRWNGQKLEDVEDRLRAAGLTDTAAKRLVSSTVAKAIRAATPGIDPEVAQDIASAIVSRTRAKYYFEDAVFRRHVGNETAKEVRDMLQSSGLAPARVQRVMDAITGQVDEAGKASVMKHRMELDMFTTIDIPNGPKVALHNLIDKDIGRLMDSYLDGAAGRSALARKGLVQPSDIDKLRTEFLRSVEPGKIKDAASLFDNTVAAVKGLPVGEDMNRGMRMMQAATQMTALSMSGLWQLAESATIVAKYGMGKTVTQAYKALPSFGELVGAVKADPAEASLLSNVLARNASQDIRLRPFLQKLEDNFHIEPTDNVLNAMTQAKQLVPYLNGMKYVHHWQAKMTGNLVANVFEAAGRGDLKAIQMLERYGLESQTMAAVKGDLLAAGLDTAKWSDATWQAVRGPLSKMMDESVLHNRTGEIPAFAQFSQVGKFVFSFRNFVLGAHNKVLAGTMAREGLQGLSLLLLYQYPLTFLAVLASEKMRNNKPKTDQQLMAQALGQMGAAGLFGELVGVVSGEKQQWGAPGLIAVDKLYRIGSSALAQRDAGATGAAIINATPLLAVLPVTKGLAETLKD